MVGQAHAGDLAQCRVWLLRRHRANLRADAALLRRATLNLECAILVAVVAELQRWSLTLLALLAPALAHQLIDRRQGKLLTSSSRHARIVRCCRMRPPGRRAPQREGHGDAG